MCGGGPAAPVLIAKQMTSDVRRGAELPVARWLALSAMLFLEGLALTVSYDAQPLLETHGWWSPLIGRAGMVIPGVTYIVAAMALFGGAPVWSDALRMHRLAAGRHRWGRYLALHVVAFALLLDVSRTVFGGRLETVAYPGALVGVWTALGGLTVAAWAGAMIPFGALGALVLRARRPLLAGVVFGCAAFAAGATTDIWWRPLGYMTLRVAFGLLSALGFSPVIVDPAEFVVGLDRFIVRIGSPCSGYQGIGLLWLFLAGYFWLFREKLRFPRVLLLVPVGTVVVWFVNAVRIAALILIGAHLSPEVAVGGFHHNAGALLFCAVALGVVGISQRTAYFTRRESSMHEETSVTAAYLVPLLVLVLTATVAGAASSGPLDPYYPARILAVAGAFWWYRGAYGTLTCGRPGMAVLTGLGAFGVWLVLVPVNAEAGGALRASVVALPSPWAAAWVVFRVVGASVTVPLAEELAFRGYLMRRLVDVRFERVPMGAASWLAIAISSVLFGALHDAVIAGTLVGIGYALVLRWRGNLADAVIAHGTTNALLALYVLLTGAWGYWA